MGTWLYIHRLSGGLVDVGIAQRRQMNASLQLIVEGRV